MHGLLEEYLVWIGAQNFSGDTVNTSRVCIGYFLDWCGERGIEDVTESRGPCSSATSGRFTSTGRRTASR